MSNEIIKFVRQRDFVFLKQLGEGACGKTYLLFDDMIDERFVCKKYSPFDENDRDSLFDNFTKEIKNLHSIYHPNCVRVFSYFLYPDQKIGYILMEYIVGKDIDQYLRNMPENINELFLQAIDGFKYLEENKILHRDIRSVNILVDENGILKIIDFGFSKKITSDLDYNKSISLNWWCELPKEFSEGKYDHSTEVYFLGKLFEKLIIDNGIREFKYQEILERMCQTDQARRLDSFVKINKFIQSEKFANLDFTQNETEHYRNFSNCIYNSISKIDSSANYYDNIESIQQALENEYKKCQLEEDVPGINRIIRCFINGPFYYNKHYTFPVEVLKDFVLLISNSSRERKNIILNNILTKLDHIKRYNQSPQLIDDLPF